MLETGALTEVERIETNLAFIPVDESDSIRESANALARAFGEYHKVLHLRARDVDAALGEGASTGESSRSSDRDVIAWLHQRESEFEGVLYEADLSSPAWTERCLRQADLVVVAARGGSRAPIKKLNSLLAKCPIGQQRGARGAPAGTQSGYRVAHARECLEETREPFPHPSRPTGIGTPIFAASPAS